MNTDEMNERQAGLRSDAEVLLDCWPEDGRTFFVEFAGTPKSGKSTCIDTINHFFRRLGFKVLAPTEGASKRTPYYLKDDLVAFNTWSASYALTHILEGQYGSDDYHIVILDRGLFDALAWFQLLKNRNEVSAYECQTIHNFLMIDHWRRLVDIVFLFATDPGTSLERESRDKLIDEHGRAMEPGFLDELNQAYSETKTQYANQFKPLYDIKTDANSQSTARETALDVATDMVRHMTAEIG